MWHATHMTTFTNNLKKLMLRHGNINVSDLAKATGLPQPTLHQLYVGTTARPRQKTMDVLAQFFGITIDQLQGVDSLPDNVPHAIKQQLDLHTTPILSWDELHQWPHDLSHRRREELILENNTSDKTFALNMHDSSMAPLFPDGCLLIFDATKQPSDRDGILVYIHDADKFAFKILLVDGANTYMKSINPDLHDVTTTQMKNNDKIIATLLEARIRF